MPEMNELHARLAAEARNYDPDAHHRSLLAPFRDVLLLWRAKFMSYEQIAATLAKHGLKVSPAGVGVFCRRNFTQADILRLRNELTRHTGPRAKPPAPPPATRPPEPTPGRGGPKVARDDL